MPQSTIEDETESIERMRLDTGFIGLYFVMAQPILPDLILCPHHLITTPVRGQEVELKKLVVPLSEKISLREVLPPRLRRLRTGEWSWSSLQWVWIRRRWQQQVVTVEAPGFGDDLESNPDVLTILIGSIILSKHLISSSSAPPPVGNTAVTMEHMRVGGEYLKTQYELLRSPYNRRVGYGCY